jgi:hypothetical protein
MKTFRFYRARLLATLLLTLVAHNASGSSGSEAGAIWTLRVPGFNNLNSVTYGNGLFVAVGGSRDSSTILISRDGVTWTQRTSPTRSWLRDVTYGNGRFVAVGWNGTILTSRDGVSWTQRALGRIDLEGVTYGNGRFVAVGESWYRFGGATILTSPDGVDWTARRSPTRDNLNGVAYGNGLFVAVGSFGTILTSP